MDFEMYFTIKRNHILIPDLEKSNLSKKLQCMILEPEHEMMTC